MSKTISIDDLCNALGKELSLYGETVIEGVKKEAKKSMSRLVKETKATAPVGRRRKHYRDSITSKKLEEFEADPVENARKIYEKLRLGDFEAVRPAMEKYAGTKRGFKKNRYQYDPHTVELVEKWCGEALHKWDYHL